MTELAIHLSKFLREHLRREQHASEHTVYTYSRCFVYLTTFAGAKLGVQPCQLRIEQLTTQVILDFLDNLEKERGKQHTHAQPPTRRNQVILSILAVPCP